jgi:hypothetical protein
LIVDRDLVSVIENQKNLNWAVIMVLFLQWNSLKKIVENGITTISTDFEAMGKFAEMISKEQRPNWE